MNTFKPYQIKLLIFIFGILCQATAFETWADSPINIIGVYKDSTTSPKISPEIVLYFKNLNHIEGTYSRGFINPEYPNSLLLGVSPLEDVHLLPNESISFNVPWGMGNPQIGFEKKYHHFTGQLHNDIIQGSFTSDWPSLRPPAIKAYKQTTVDLKQNVHAYVEARISQANKNIQALDAILSCQEKRNHLPEKHIEIIGRWLKVESNGEHEWGYDVILFKLGDEFHGWLEDYSGLIGDGGIRYLMNDIQFNKNDLKFKSSLGEFHAVVEKSRSQLDLISYGDVTHLIRQALPDIDWVWKQYQALNVKCE